MKIYEELRSSLSNEKAHLNSILNVETKNLQNGSYKHDQQSNQLDNINLPSSNESLIVSSFDLKRKFQSFF